MTRAAFLSEAEYKHVLLLLTEYARSNDDDRLLLSAIAQLQHAVASRGGRWYFALTPSAGAWLHHELARIVGAGWVENPRDARFARWLHRRLGEFVVGSTRRIGQRRAR